MQTTKSTHQLAHKQKDAHPAAFTEWAPQTPISANDQRPRYTGKPEGNANPSLID